MKIVIIDFHIINCLFRSSFNEVRRGCEGGWEGGAKGVRRGCEGGGKGGGKEGLGKA